MAILQGLKACEVTMDPQTFQQFRDALLNRHRFAMAGLLQSLSADEVKVAVGTLLSGMLVGPEIDPTDVLCAGDIADRMPDMRAHAIVIYDVALQHMYDNRQSIASDTDCAAASLNLIDLSRKQGDRVLWLRAIRRAAVMPIKRADQKVHIAWWLHEANEDLAAYLLFSQGIEGGRSTVATEMGLPEAELIQMEHLLEQRALHAR
ncbi:MAG: hypothetical protein ACREDR_09870 [Blastocatellia bacterium]